MHYHSLSRSKTDRHMEPFIIDIDENDETSFNQSAHEGEEFIMVMKGMGGNHLRKEHLYS